MVDLSGKLCGYGKPMSDQLRDHLAGVSDPATVSDVVAQTFLHDPTERQQLIEMLDVTERLRYLADRLSMILAKE